MIEAASTGRHERLAFGLLAAAAGAAAGLFGLTEGRWLTLSFELSPQVLIAAPIGLLLVHAMARRPEIGLHVLLLLAWSNGSEVLVEQGLPSVLQLIVPLLLLVLAWAALRETGSGPERVAAPPRLLLLFGLAAAGYACWAWLSTAWAVEPERGFGVVVELGKAVLLALVVAFVVDRPARLRRACWTLLIVSAVLAALSSWQVLTGSWEQDFLGLARVKDAHIAGHVFRPRTTGPLSDPNFYAQMLLPLVPVGVALALGRGSRWLRLSAAALAGLTAVGVATTYSRGGVLALAAALGLLGWLERRRVGPRQAMLALALGIALLPALPDSFWNRLGTLEVLLPVEQEGLQSYDSSVNKRKLVMGAAALMALDNPVAGVGAGNYTTRFYVYADQIGAEGRVYNLVGEQAYAHSLYLEQLAETGLVGFLLFALVAGLALQACRLAHERFERSGEPAEALLARALACGLAGLLISSLILHGDYPRYAWILLGLCAAASGAALRERREAAR